MKNYVTDFYSHIFNFREHWVHVVKKIAVKIKIVAEDVAHNVVAIIAGNVVAIIAKNVAAIIVKIAAAKNPKNVTITIARNAKRIAMPAATFSKCAASAKAVVRCVLAYVVVSIVLFHAFLSIANLQKHV